ncbi:ankyrin repeat and KH domain-containing protein 1 [Diaphorina citri]|uniref:Ankyrin repeat and KH domain-containing protein 1 n=2 Tax=Diaphorina citri TaxID=121845 RepID=A0A3Q0JDM6_DIACI|nr:ankyrin repeat and KH domain-containing protein 1 [Diaphorina citri]
MQNVSSDTTNNNEKIDKGNSTLQDLGKVSTPQSFNSSPIKSEFDPSYAEIFLSDTSDSEDDDVSEVEAFVIDQDDLADEAEMEEKYYLPSEEDSEDHTVDPETQARLEALLEAAGIGKLATGDGKLADPEVLRRLTSSVSCALDEAAAALTRMRNENPRPQNERSLVQACSDGDVKTVKKLLTEGRSVHETTDEGESLLSLACSAGYYELAQVLLAMHANVEDRGIKGECTPLMEAASSGFIEIVRLLINHGADVNGQSSSGNTPLMYACAGGHEAVVRVLLECGANVEDHNENGHTPLMEAASAGHVGVAKILLEYGAGINTHSNEFKESALTLACYKGHLDMVRFLLSAGADQEHKTDEMHTALMEASMDGHVEVAKLLLDSGAQVKTSENEGESLLSLACSAGYYELAQVLLAMHANVEDRGIKGECTPLMEAASSGNVNGLQASVILIPGAKINAHTEETQETALTLACCGGFLDVADFLLKNGANIELGASTPLMEAAQEGHLELVRYLLDSGAQVHAKTQTGDTALTYACENGHTDVADLLLSYGANLVSNKQINISSVLSKDNLTDNSTMLIEAAKGGHANVVQLLLDFPRSVVPRFIHLVHAKTQTGDTALTYACENGHTDVADLLLSYGANLDNSTMLIEAAKGGHANVVQLLLDFPRSVIGGSLSSPSDDSSSHLCSQGKKSGVHAKTQTGDTALTYACENGHTDVADLLLSYGANLFTLNGVVATQNPASPNKPVAQNSPTVPMNPAPTSVSAVSSQPGVAGPNQTATSTVNTTKVSRKGLTSSEVQQVKNAPQTVLGLTAEEALKCGDLTESKMSFLLQDPKCQGPLANFFQSQFFIDHLKRMKGKDESHLMQRSGDLSSPPSPPMTPPPSSTSGDTCHRPLTPPLPPLNYFGVDTANSTQSPRSGVTQVDFPGLVVGTQPLFHPGANTTVLHNTIYTRSSVPVPSPADVNQSTAICDRPKAKPVSKKEGKNVKKHHLAAYHFAVQQQKEALQLKQLVEMNEQLVSQVVSQQKQLVLNSSSGVVVPEAPDPSVPSSTASPLLSNDILADSMARSKLLASTAKEMMESMSVKVDMDQETRDLIDQLETITMEEVERAASQGQKKLLQDKLQDYAAGLQDGLKMAATNVSDPTQQRFQQVGVNFVAGGSGSAVGSQGPEDAYQYFTVPSPGGPVQVQQYTNGFQLQYQVSRQEISQYSKVDANGSPFPSPTLSPKNDSPPGADSLANTASPPPASVATQTPAETPPPCVKKAMRTISSAVASATSAPGGKIGKKRDARGPAAAGYANHAACASANAGHVDPSSQTRFPGGSTTDTPSPGSVTTTTSYSGMDVDSETESNHDTALTLACAGGHEELVELLLSRGADIEHRDKKGFTPLILAATAGHDKVVDILLNHKADMEAQSERTKDTPLSLACSGGRYEVVELLLTRGANKEHRNVSDYTPLSLAASGGYVNIIKLLLTHGAEINSRTGSKLGISPLMLAAMNGHTAAVKLLLDMGSDINAQIETNRNTALTLACFQGRHEVVSLLLDRKANVEHRAKTGLTPLMEAASGGYVEVGRVLLDKGADVNAPPVPSSRDTALTIAADKGHCRFVELLLSKGAQVEVKNKKGNSPLWLAANGGHLSVVELLCKHGADIDSQDNRKVSCLMAAFRKGHVKAVRWMVNHVAQFPSDQEMTRYIQTVNDKELLDKCQECSMVIRVAKNQQAERANKNANILLEELDMEKWREESKRAAQARKRERKKQKKLEKKEEKRKAMEEEEEKKEEKRKAMEEEEEEEEEVEVQEVEGEMMEEETEENDMHSSGGGRGEGEEGDSGIDANSQASCSSNEVKTAAPNSRRKDKKKKKSASTTNVPASVPKATNGGKVQKNASTSAVATKQEKSNAATKAAAETSSKKIVETKSEPASVSSNTAVTPPGSTSAKDKKSAAYKKYHELTTPRKEPQHLIFESSRHPAEREDFEATGNDTFKERKRTSLMSLYSDGELIASSSGVKIPPTKQQYHELTPRKEPQHLIFESSRHPAEREDFEATGNDTFKERKRTSLMSLYSDGELIASSSGVKIPPTKQQVGGRREEGWKEVVRKYLNTTFRHKKVSVPLNAISRVIGRGGSNINAIRSATSAHIEVEKQCKGQGERIITIKGNNEAIKQAHSLINALIRDPDVDLLKLLYKWGHGQPVTYHNFHEGGFIVIADGMDELLHDSILVYITRQVHTVQNTGQRTVPRYIPIILILYTGNASHTRPWYSEQRLRAGFTLYLRVQRCELSHDPLQLKDLLKMVPGPSYIPTSVSMSRLNPRAPDFSSVKTQQQQQPPLFNASIPPPVVPFPTQNKFPPTRWPYAMNYNPNQPPDMMNLIAHSQAGDLFSTTMENTPPTSPPHAMDGGERRVPPRPIGTERAWKNYNNVIGSTPLEDPAPWLQQDKSFGGIGDNRHLFRNSAVPQYSRLPLPEDLAPPLPAGTHLLDNYQDAAQHYNMNGGATLMLLPQQQQSFGLASLLPDALKPDTSWCMSDVPLTADKPQPPPVWTKWTN